MVKWAIELGKHDIKITPRNAIKSQVVADFIAEFTHREELRQGENSLDDDKEWQLFVDGASNSRGSGAGMVFITLEGTIIEIAMTLGFAASNNEAEYEALLLGLRTAKDLKIKRLTVHYDSQLAANQLTG